MELGESKSFDVILPKVAEDQTRCPVCQLGGYAYMDASGVYYKHPNRIAKCRIPIELSVAILKARKEYEDAKAAGVFKVLDSSD